MTHGAEALLLKEKQIIYYPWCITIFPQNILIKNVMSPTHRREGAVVLWYVHHLFAAMEKFIRFANSNGENFKL